jgi:hypothetical protein
MRLLQHWTPQNKMGRQSQSQHRPFHPTLKGRSEYQGQSRAVLLPCNLAKNDTDPRETNQWPHIERRLAEIAATPLISHRRLKEILPELVKQVYA